MDDKRQEQEQDGDVLTFVPADLGYQKSAIFQYLPISALSLSEQDHVEYLFDKLEDQKATLVLNYVQHWDLVKAAKDAGYAATMGLNDLYRRLIEPIETLVTLLKKADRAFLSKQSGISRARWMEEVRAVAFFDPADMLDKEGAMLKIQDMPKAARVALKVAMKSVKNTKSGKDCEELEIRYSPYNKIESLKMWGEAAGYLDDTQMAEKPAAIEIIFTESKQGEDDPVVVKAPELSWEDQELSREVYIPE